MEMRLNQLYFIHFFKPKELWCIFYIIRKHDQNPFISSLIYVIWLKYIHTNLSNLWICPQGQLSKYVRHLGYKLPGDFGNTKEVYKIVFEPVCL